MSLHVPLPFGKQAKQSLLTSYYYNFKWNNTIEFVQAIRKMKNEMNNW